MLTTQGIVMRDILIALAIALPVFLVAGIFYFSLRRVVRRLTAKTGTALDNMLVEALEWSVFAGIILAGMYFSILYLPLKESFDFEIRRGFHVAFITLAAYGGAALVDSIFRWFKLEVKRSLPYKVDLEGTSPREIHSCGMLPPLISVA